MLHTRQDEVIENQSVFLDGVRFVRCRFVGCTLIYECRDDVDFQDCTFEECSWTFSDAAIRMLNFLSTVYQEAGPTGTALVSGIFKSIKDHRLLDLRHEDSVTHQRTSTMTHLAS